MPNFSSPNKASSSLYYQLLYHKIFSSYSQRGLDSSIIFFRIRLIILFCPSFCKIAQFTTHYLNVSSSTLHYSPVLIRTKEIWCCYCCIFANLQNKKAAVFMSAFKVRHYLLTILYQKRLLQIQKKSFRVYVNIFGIFQP